VEADTKLYGGTSRSIRPKSYESRLGRHPPLLGKSWPDRQAGWYRGIQSFVPIWDERFFIMPGKYKFLIYTFRKSISRKVTLIVKMLPKEAFLIYLKLQRKYWRYYNYFASNISQYLKLTSKGKLVNTII